MSNKPIKLTEIELERRLRRYYLAGKRAAMLSQADRLLEASGEAWMRGQDERAKTLREESIEIHAEAHRCKQELAVWGNLDEIIELLKPTTKHPTT